MPRPIIYVYESFQDPVDSTKHKRCAAIQVSVEAPQAGPKNPVRVLVLRQTKTDSSPKPEISEHAVECGNHGQDHTGSCPEIYKFPAKGVDCIQRIIVLAWDKNEMIQSPNPANVEVRHLALTFAGA